MKTECAAVSLLTDSVSACASSIWTALFCIISYCALKNKEGNKKIKVVDWCLCIFMLQGSTIGKKGNLAATLALVIMKEYYLFLDNMLSEGIGNLIQLVHWVLSRP